MRLIVVTAVVFLMFSNVAIARCNDTILSYFSVVYQSNSCWETVLSKDKAKSVMHLSKSSLEKLIERAEAAGFSYSDVEMVALQNMLIAMKAKKLEEIGLPYPNNEKCLFYRIKNKKMDTHVDNIVVQDSEKKCEDVTLNISILLLYHLQEAVAFFNRSRELGIKLRRSVLKKDGHKALVFAQNISSATTRKSLGFYEFDYIGLDKDKIGFWFDNIKENTGVVLLSPTDGSVYGVISAIKKTPDNVNTQVVKFWPTAHGVKYGALTGKVGENFEDAIKYVARDQAGGMSAYLHSMKSGKIYKFDRRRYRIIDYASEFLKYHNLKIDDVDEKIRRLFRGN